MYVCVSVYVCIYVCVCVELSVCMCVLVMGRKYMRVCISRCVLGFVFVHY